MKHPSTHHNTKAEQHSYTINGVKKYATLLSNDITRKLCSLVNIQHTNQRRDSKRCLKLIAKGLLCIVFLIISSCCASCSAKYNYNKRTAKHHPHHPAMHKEGIKAHYRANY